MKLSSQHSDKNYVAINTGNIAVSPRLLVVSLSLSMLLSALGTSIANVGLPAIAQTFSATFQQVQWVVLTYLLAITTLVVSVGRLGDTTGRRRLLLFGIFLFTLASLLCAVAPSLSLLLAARAAQGMGAAIMMALTLAFVGTAVSPEKSGGAIGLLGSMSAIGTALGPSLGGVLVNDFGWRSIFLVNLPLGCLTYFLACRFLPIDRDASTIVRDRFDLAGTVLLILTLTAFALAMTMGQSNFGLLNVTLLIAAAIGLLGFILVQVQTESPLINLAILRNRKLCAGFVMNILVTTVVMTTLVVGPFYLSGALALAAGQVGLVMSSGPIVAALTGVPAGQLVDRVGAHRVRIVGLVTMALGSIIFALLPTRLGVPGYIAPLILITTGYALFQAANNTAVMTNIPQDQRGLISGLLTLSRNLGLITGASAMGTVFAFGSASLATANNILATPPADVAAGMRLTFAVALALIVVAIIVACASQVKACAACPTTR